ncbi:hypothetical protein SUDANB148_04072 [Streptomyces sp. SudanB148_2056]
MVHVWLTERGGGLVNACTWGDWSSVGTALSADSGGGVDTAANLTRAVREAVLHEAADG